MRSRARVLAGGGAFGYTDYRWLQSGLRLPRISPRAHVCGGSQRSNGVPHKLIHVAEPASPQQEGPHHSTSVQ